MTHPTGSLLSRSLATAFITAAMIASALPAHAQNYGRGGYHGRPPPRPQYNHHNNHNNHNNYYNNRGRGGNGNSGLIAGALLGVIAGVAITSAAQRPPPDVVYSSPPPPPPGVVYYTNSYPPPRGY